MSIEVMVGILLMLYGVSLNILYSDFFLLSLIPVIMGTLLVLYSFIKGKINKSVRKVLFIVICIGLLLFIGVEAIIIGIPKICTENKDYIVVMPTNLEETNGYVSLTLKGRLDLVVKSIYQDANDSLIILTGGDIENSELCEADIMEEYLLNQGIPKNKIIKECTSKVREESLLKIKKIIEDDSKKNINESSIKLITTNYEALSTRLLLNRLGFDNIELSSSDTILYFAPVLYTAEFYFVTKNFLINTIMQ